MNPNLPGLHHVTAVTADAQKNIDFYCGVLGLRLVKLTVNFDDPRSYHLYYGDETRSPGTIMTFFAWPGAPRGRVGPPQVTATSFAVPKEAMPYWAARFAESEAATRPVSDHFGEGVLSFEDPDGMALEIVATAMPVGQEPAGGPIPANQAIRGFHSVTLAEEGHELTAKLLSDVMGFQLEKSEGNRFRYRARGEMSASVVDLLCVPDSRHGDMGAGIVHHVAFRTQDDVQLREWRSKVARLGYNISPIMNRNYFHSIYFREPGGVLFEIATDTPGFASDEPADQLGTRLMLPSSLENRRAELEAILPPVRLPDWASRI